MGRQLTHATWKVLSCCVFLREDKKSVRNAPCTVRHTCLNFTLSNLQHVVIKVMKRRKGYKVNCVCNFSLLEKREIPFIARASTAILIDWVGNMNLTIVPPRHQKDFQRALETHMFRCQICALEINAQFQCNDCHSFGTVSNPNGLPHWKNNWTYPFGHETCFARTAPKSNPHLPTSLVTNDFRNLCGNVFSPDCDMSLY